MKKLGVLLVLLLLFSFSAMAEETDWVTENLEQSGAADLWGALSDDTRALYRAIGVDSLADLTTVTVSPENLFSTAADLMGEQAKQPLAATGVLLAAVVLCAYLGGMRETVNEAGMANIYNSVSVLGVSAVVLVPFTACIRSVQAALSGAGVFMGSFSPVYVAVLAANGQLRMAASYQTVLLLFSQLLTWLTGGVLLPVLLAAVAMGMITAVADTGNLGKLGEMLLKGVSWTLGILAGVFTTLLSVNGMLGAAGDTLGNKMIKLSISSFVPVVGGAVSEAFLTVRSCCGIVKSTVGAFGIVTAVLLLLPAVVQCLCWLLALWVCRMAAEAFEQQALTALLKTVEAVVRTMLAALAVCAVFMIVATTVVIVAGRGMT